MEKSQRSMAFEKLIRGESRAEPDDSRFEKGNWF